MYQHKQEIYGKSQLLQLCFSKNLLVNQIIIQKSQINFSILNKNHLKKRTENKSSNEGSNEPKPSKTLCQFKMKQKIQYKLSLILKQNPQSKKLYRNDSLKGYINQLLAQNLVVSLNDSQN
ncbi:unnamed protein product [Paramecium primaurelia]|uniref:Uncharacterized protein n=1 Tax=Paramecium primaurelia TaxID=5886 RepID=A0A8S1PLL2_PARPR|nr:unnamed protein product [Paramecium primaurelia]